MQEEVENRTVNLAISTTKLTVRAILSGYRKYQSHHTKSKAATPTKQAETPHGKQTVKELVGQGQGVSSIPLAKTKLRDFHKVAQKYGIDYAITKDKTCQPARYLVFFKAKDADVLNAAFREFMAKTLGRKKAASVLGELEQEKSRTAPDKTREKNMERSL